MNTVLSVEDVAFLRRGIRHLNSAYTTIGTRRMTARQLDRILRDAPQLSDAQVEAALNPAEGAAP